MALHPHCSNKDCTVSNGIDKLWIPRLLQDVLRRKQATTMMGNGKAKACYEMANQPQKVLKVLLTNAGKLFASMEEFLFRSANPDISSTPMNVEVHTLVGGQCFMMLWEEIKFKALILTRYSYRDPNPNLRVMCMGGFPDEPVGSIAAKFRRPLSFVETAHDPRPRPICMAGPRKKLLISCRPTIHELKHNSPLHTRCRL